MDTEEESVRVNTLENRDCTHVRSEYILKFPRETKY